MSNILKLSLAEKEAEILKKEVELLKKESEILKLTIEQSHNKDISEIDNDSFGSGPIRHTSDGISYHGIAPGDCKSEIMRHGFHKFFHNKLARHNSYDGKWVTKYDPDIFCNNCKHIKINRVMDVYICLGHLIN